jgi:RNase P subunit RPR2
MSVEENEKPSTINVRCKCGQITRFTNFILRDERQLAFGQKRLSKQFITKACVVMNCDQCGDNWQEVNSKFITRAIESYIEENMY